MNIKNLVSNPEEFPELFEHYFYYWSGPELAFEADGEKISCGEKLILNGLPEIEKHIKERITVKNDLNAVLFVGQNVSNGHAALLQDKWWLWLPVEAYSSEEQVRAFVSHEAVHALHYSLSPDFYFHTKEQKNLVSRQIMTEGLATYVSMEIMDLDLKQALWADFISEQEFADWMDLYRGSKKEIAQLVLDQWNDDAGGLFQANNPKDIFRYRVGYIIALEAVQKVAKDFENVKDLLSLTYKDFESKVKAVLEEMK